MPLKRNLLNYSGIGALALVSACNQAETRPVNILFIMADDHAWQAISAYDGALIQTPNIDALAGDGVTFTKSYCTNAISGPSRAVLLTGKHNHLNGQINNDREFDGGQFTFPKALREQGYQTAMIGKWHLKSDPTGFDHWDILPGQGDYYNPNFIDSTGKRREDGYVTNIITDKAIDWLTKNGNNPFCLLVHHKAPHRNWMPDTSYFDLFKDRDIPVPENFEDSYAGRNAASQQDLSIAKTLTIDYDLKLPYEQVGSYENEFMRMLHGKWNDGLHRLDEKTKTRWKDHYQQRLDEFLAMDKTDTTALKRWKLQQYLEDYLQCVASVDDNIGRLLNHLKETGQYENTLIVYTSDQGFYLGEHGWFDKRFMYEESFRIPLIMKAPGQKTSEVNDTHLVQNLDFAPTFLDYAGCEIPSDIQGLSMKTIFDGTAQDWRSSIYYHYYEYPAKHGVKRHYGIKTDRYKLIHFYYDIDEWELYDLESDPKEMNNLIQSPKHSELTNHLKGQLFKLQSEYGDTIFASFLPSKPARIEHLALNCTYAIDMEPSSKYPDIGDEQLSNGEVNPPGEYISTSYRNWVGFNNGAPEIVLDLGESKKVRRIESGFLQKQMAWIFAPEMVEFFISEEGIIYEPAGNPKFESSTKDIAVRKQEFKSDLIDKEIRFIKIKVHRLEQCPEWHPGKGEPAWLFMDEIVVK